MFCKGDFFTVCDHLVDTLGPYSAVGWLLKERAKELPCELLLLQHSVLCWDGAVNKSLCLWSLSIQSSLSMIVWQVSAFSEHITVVNDVIFKRANVWYSLKIFAYEGSYVLPKTFSAFFFSTSSSLPASLLRFSSLYLFSFEFFQVCLQAQRKQNIFFELFCVIIGKFFSEHGPQFPVKSQWICKGLWKIICIVLEGHVGELRK